MTNKAATPRKTKRWHIVYPTRFSQLGYRESSRSYTVRSARRIADRFNQRFGDRAAYLKSLTVWVME